LKLKSHIMFFGIGLFLLYGTNLALIRFVLALYLRQFEYSLSKELLVNEKIQIAMK
jgi:hypothetical protein